jgi:hypothetical protein
MCRGVCLYVRVYDVFVFVQIIVHRLKINHRKHDCDHGYASVGPALGYWVKEGLGLVVHFPGRRR